MEERISEASLLTSAAKDGEVSGDTSGGGGSERSLKPKGLGVGGVDGDEWKTNQSYSIRWPSKYPRTFLPAIPDMVVRLQTGVWTTLKHQEGDRRASMGQLTILHDSDCTIDVAAIGGIDLGHGNLRWALINSTDSHVEAPEECCIVLRARSGAQFQIQKSSSCAFVQLIASSAKQRSSWVRAYRAYLEAYGCEATRLQGPPVRPASAFLGTASRHARFCANDPQFATWTSGVLNVAALSSVAYDFEPQYACTPSIAEKTRLLAASNPSGHIEAKLIQLHRPNDAPMAVRGYDDSLRLNERLVIDVKSILSVRLGYAEGRVPPSQCSGVEATRVLLLTLSCFDGHYCKLNEREVLLVAETPEIRLAWLAMFDQRLRTESYKCFVHAPTLVATPPAKSVACGEWPFIVLVAYALVLTLLYFVPLLKSSAALRSSPPSLPALAPAQPDLPVWDTSTPGLSIFIGKAVHEPPAGDVRTDALNNYTRVAAFRGESFPLLVIGTHDPEFNVSAAQRNSTLDLSRRIGQGHAHWPQDRIVVFTNLPEQAFRWFRLLDTPGLAELFRPPALLAHFVRPTAVSMTLTFDLHVHPSDTVSYDPRTRIMTLNRTLGGRAPLVCCGPTAYMRAVWNILAYNIGSSQPLKNLQVAAPRCIAT